jgi:YVTN family beta-propeller protein
MFDEETCSWWVLPPMLYETVSRAQRACVPSVRLCPAQRSTTLGRMRRGGQGQRILTTVLFTDIVGSTQRAEALGDRQWRQLLASHHRVMRRALKEHHGREIDTSGDGFFATFDQPSEAIACALEMIDRLRPLDIDIRAGVHLGEVEVLGPTLSGITVHVGARVMAKAGAAQVLVSSTVRDLMTGSDVAFQDEGFHELKGVASQVHLFAVRHEARAPETPDVAPSEEEPRRRIQPAWVVAGVLAVAAAVSIVALTRGGAAGFVPAPNTVVELDPSDGSVTRGVAVGTNPTVLSFDGASVWVANFDDKTVQRIHVADATADAAQGAKLDNPTGIATGAGAVWVANGFVGQLVRIDPGQSNAVTSIELSSGIQGVAYGEGAVWIASPNDGTLIRWTPSTRERSEIRLPSGAHPEDVAIGDGAVWVTDRDGGRVLRVDPVTLKVGAQIPLLGDRAPTRIAFGEGYVWVTSTDADSVTRIDPASNAATTIEHVGNGPLGIAAGDGSVWVANSLDGTVAWIDPKNGTVSGTTQVGDSPDSIAVTPGGVWVSVHTL